MVSDEQEGQRHDRWARLRFSIVGPLLASPPDRGQLAREIAKLAAKTWLHPVTGRPTGFAFSTIEHWYYSALAARVDPIGALRRKLRSDCGQQSSVNEKLRPVLEA